MLPGLVHMTKLHDIASKEFNEFFSKDETSHASLSVYVRSDYQWTMNPSNKAMPHVLQVMSSGQSPVLFRVQRLAARAGGLQ